MDGGGYVPFLSPQVRGDDSRRAEMELMFGAGISCYMISSR